MRCILAIVIILGLLVCGQAFAQIAENPPRTAEEIRQSLFEAQVALMQGDTATAQRAVEHAAALYTDILSPQFARNVLSIDERLQEYFTQALADIQAADTQAFAALRSAIWTGLLDASSQVVFSAINAGDGATAALWLPLRDFRSSTRFSRPTADATLAVNALVRGTVQSEVALEAVEADLLDTYQAQLAVSLADANEAHRKGFVLRRAEEAGLAAGYFEILSAAYAGQRGEETLSAARGQFALLVAAATANDEATFIQAQAEIDSLLIGFRAVPLAAEQLARRAGQLVRFVSLVPVEYERGVHSGIATSDIEIQEALTFHEGALAAYNDLQSALLDLDAGATKRVGDLLALLPMQVRDVVEPAELQATVDEISTLLADLLPAEWLNIGGTSDIDVILSILDQVENAVRQDDYKLAESARLEAYAMLELGIEQRLRGFAPDMAQQIESLFWQGTGARDGLAVQLASQAPLAEVRATLADLQTAFGEASLVLGSANSAPAAVASNAAIIVFREGLEAVLILASLLASLRSVEQRRYRRPLVIGAILAFFATVLTWWFATSLLKVLLPLGETLEAIVSLIAIGVLLLITNWFFHKVYWVGWMANFHTRKQQLVGGMVVITISQTVGLMILGFTSVYREGFETVLFLQSLVLEAGISVVLQGVLLGLVGTAIVGVITFGLQVRLPYKRMLIVTGVLIAFVLVTMVGHTVHVMQSIGWLPITPIQGVYLPYWSGQWLGLYATWQSVILQVFAATFVIGSYFLAEHQNKSNRRMQPGVEQRRFQRVLSAAFNWWRSA